MLKASDKYQTLHLLAIDPGLNNIGLAIFEIDTITPRIVSIRALTLTEDRVVDDINCDSEHAVERDAKRRRMIAALMRVVVNADPDCIACESPFFNQKRPASFVVLAEVIAALREAVGDYNPRIPFTFIAPQEAKKTLGVAGKLGKEVVKEAIEQHEILPSLMEPGPDLLSEHALDAIMIGYTYFLNMVKKGKNDVC